MYLSLYTTDGQLSQCLIPLLYVVRVRHEVTSLFGHPQQSIPPTPDP